MKSILFASLALLAVFFYPACEKKSLKDAKAMDVRSHVLHSIEAHDKKEGIADSHETHADPTPVPAPTPLRQAAPAFPTRSVPADAGIETQDSN